MSGDQSPILNVNAPPVIVPVVLPASADLSLSGKIRNLEVRAVDNSGWLVYDDDEKEWLVVNKHGRRHLRDYYLEEDDAAGWATYQRYTKDWKAGNTQQSFPTHLLPKKVQDMQRGAIGPDKKDPWLLPSPKPTTGTTVVADALPSPVKGSKA